MNWVFMSVIFSVSLGYSKETLGGGDLDCSFVKNDSLANCSHARVRCTDGTIGYLKNDAKAKEIKLKFKVKKKWGDCSLKYDWKGPSIDMAGLLLDGYSFRSFLERDDRVRLPDSAEIDRFILDSSSILNSRGENTCTSKLIPIGMTREPVVTFDDGKLNIDEKLIKTWKNQVNSTSLNTEIKQSNP